MTNDYLSSTVQFVRLNAVYHVLRLEDLDHEILQKQNKKKKTFCIVLR